MHLNDKEHRFFHAMVQPDDGHLCQTPNFIIALPFSFFSHAPVLRSTKRYEHVLNNLFSNLPPKFLLYELVPFKHKQTCFHYNLNKEKRVKCKRKQKTENMEANPKPQSSEHQFK